MKTNQSRISVIIPAYNEEGNLARTIENILSIPEYSIDIIVVDDGSEDNTYLEASNSGSKLLDIETTLEKVLH